MRLPVSLLALSLVGFSAAVQAEEPPPLAPMQLDGATTVNYEGVINLIETRKDLVVVDSRPATDYAHGHIEGAVNIVSTDMTEPGVLAAKVPAKETPVMFYCQGVKCGRAAASVKKAVGWGYGNVYYYANGMDEWLAEGMPTLKE